MNEHFNCFEKDKIKPFSFSVYIILIFTKYYMFFGQITSFTCAFI